jgi:hypothetical protein
LSSSKNVDVDGFPSSWDNKTRCSEERLDPTQNLLLGSHRCLVLAANWWTTEISIFVRKADFRLGLDCFLDFA